MALLNAEENLIVQVAKATCFVHRIDAAQAPASEVGDSVEKLIQLWNAKRTSRDDPLDGRVSVDLRGAIESCAGELDSVLPDQAARLRAALAA